MSQATEVRVPDTGDVSDVPVIELHIAAGDQVALEDPLVTLEMRLTGVSRVGAAGPGRGGPAPGAGVRRNHPTWCETGVRYVIDRSPHESALVGDSHQLSPVASVELDHRSADVSLGGRGTDHKLLGDLRVTQAGGCKRHDLSFTFRQLLEPLGDWRVEPAVSRQFAQQATHNASWKQRLSAGDQQH